MTDFAQVFNVKVDHVTPADNTVMMSYQVEMQHAGATVQTSRGFTFQFGGIAAMETAIAADVRQGFLDQFGVALGANLIVINSSKLI